MPGGRQREQAGQRGEPMMWSQFQTLVLRTSAFVGVSPYQGWIAESGHSCQAEVFNLQKSRAANSRWRPMTNGTHSKRHNQWIESKSPWMVSGGCESACNSSFHGLGTPKRRLLISHDNTMFDAADKVWLWNNILCMRETLWWKRPHDEPDGY